ncbi:MAG: tRNA (adenosine(37)-N6)-dimethylallyltransferase MiaA [Deltaproteobacteria bacterium]|nr:tRNA (adenosine(37)-N6)-dimethylallyltransferase MiaA [Deltaproteobacteria bacterium]
MQKLLILCGPTGIGKTALSLEVAEKMGAEIIGADSQTVLKDFNIGTAKPSSEEQERVPHHLLDVVCFNEVFDAVSFVKLADEAIAAVRSKNKIPLICGGSGLYLKALVYGLMEAPKRDVGFRKALEERIEQEGLQNLYQELQTIDAFRAAQIHPHDALRIIRALELHHLSGQKPSALSSAHQFREKRYETLKIGLRLPLEELYARINARVIKMLEAGWLTEVQGLLTKGYDLLYSKTQALGYKTLALHLEGKISLEQAIKQIQKETRHYAKRQMTWFRADPEIVWFHPQAVGEILEKINFFLATFLESRR